MRSLCLVLPPLLATSMALANHIPQTDGPVTFDIPDGPPPAGHPDLMMLTFTLSTSVGSIVALELTIQGFTRQVGDPQAFADNGSLDSHFLFDPIDDNLVIDFAEESPSILRASFSGFEPFQHRDIAQMVTAQIGEISTYHAHATVLFDDGSTEEFGAQDTIIPNFVPAPQPAAAMCCFGLILGARSRRAAP